MFEEGNDEYQELIAPYLREENVFRLRQCQRSLEKGEWTVIYEVPANYLQKAKERHANDSVSEYGAQETSYLMHS